MPKQIDQPRRKLCLMIDQRSFAVSRTEAELASELMAMFGESAGWEAARRARKSRDKGNAVRFCTWRKTEQLIALLDSQTDEQTFH